MCGQTLNVHTKFLCEKFRFFAFRFILMRTKEKSRMDSRTVEINRRQFYPFEDRFFQILFSRRLSVKSTVNSCSFHRPMQ